MAQEPGRTPPSTRVHQRPRVDRPTQHPEIDLLAAEAVSLIVRACSTRVGVDALTRMADDDPEVLLTAADRCGRIDDLDHRVRQQAAELLRRAAAHLPADGRGGGTARRGQRGGS